MPRLSGKTAATAAFVLLFAALAWKAGKEALADAYLNTAVRAAARPAGTGTPSAQDIWRQARLSLEHGLRYAPRNPQTLQQAGLQDLRALRVHPDSRPHTLYARSAYANFRSALAQRPTSAEDWANLALAKFYLAQWDAEMLAALEHADELGRWEFQVQREVLFVRISAWSWLDQEQRAETVRIAERAVRRNADEVAQLLRNFNRLDLLCASRDVNPKVQAWCGPQRPSAAAKKPPARRRARQRAAP